MYTRGVAKQPEKINFNSAEKDDNKVDEYDGISKKLVFYTSEHWVKM